MPPGGLHSFGGYCKDVEVLDVGLHRGDVYTIQDLRDIERNFRLGVGLVDPPVSVGHEEDQPLVRGMVENTGAPAVGWVTALRVGRRKGADGKVRPVLLADLHHVHPEIAALINSRAYRKVSPEIYGEDGYPEDAPPGWHGKALRRLALLGGQLPHIKTLRDLPAVRFGEAVKPPPHRQATLRRCGRARTADGKGWAVFSEVIPMDRSTLEDQLKALGWSDAMIEAAKPLPDDAFAALANAALAQAAGADTGGTAGGEGPPADMGTAPTGMVEWPPEAPSRDEVIAQLVAAGQDEATLQAMTDEELLAKWQETNGGTAAGAAPMSETPKNGAKTFAEQLKRSILADVRRELGEVRSGVKAVRSAQQAERLSARLTTVRRYCELWREMYAYTPAQLDEKSTELNVFHDLMNASDERVMKFGEKTQTEFQARLAHYTKNAKKNGARVYGEEKIRDPKDATGFEAVDAAVDDFAKRRYGRRAAK